MGRYLDIARQTRARGHTCGRGDYEITELNEETPAQAVCPPAEGGTQASYEENELDEETSDPAAAYDRLWRHACNLDDAIQAARAVGDEDQAERLRARLRALIVGPYAEVRERYLATRAREEEAVA